jgi:hypothetical protein
LLELLGAADATSQQQNSKGPAGLVLHRSSQQVTSNILLL